MAKIDNLQKQKDDLERADMAANSGASGPTAPTAVKVTNPQVQQHLEELKNQISTVKTSIASITNEIQNPAGPRSRSQSTHRRVSGSALRPPR